MYDFFEDEYDVLELILGIILLIIELVFVIQLSTISTIRVFVSLIVITLILISSSVYSLGKASERKHIQEMLTKIGNIYEEDDIDIED